MTKILSHIAHALAGIDTASRRLIDVRTGTRSISRGGGSVRQF